MKRWLADAELYAAAGHTHVPIPIEEIRHMATGHKVKVGKVSAKALAKGKVAPADSTPATLRKGKAMKADRAAKGYVKNREAKR